MDDMAFQAALTHYNKEFDEAEPFDNWFPPDNSYTVMVSKIKRGVSQKENVPFVWWKIMVTITANDHPDVDGKDFQLAFCSNKGFGQMKTICNQISQNTTRRKVQDYDKEIDGYVGTVLNVRVHREKSQKTGKTYVATDITEIVPTEDDSSEVMSEAVASE